MSDKKYLGKLIAAHPNNPRDGLAASTIIIIDQNEKSTVGLQINHQMSDLDLETVALGLGIECDENAPLYYGGNVGTGKVHVIHTLDWTGISTVKITEQLGMTNDISVITAIAGNEGPKEYRACAGFWRWDRDQLEQQLDPKKEAKYRWESIDATPDLVFGLEGRDQWYAVLEESAAQQVNSWF